MLALLLAPSLAFSAPPAIAVLEFRNTAGLHRDEAAYVTDLVRSKAVELFPDYYVMTRENILERLPPGTNLADCEGECEVETGRKVGADYVVSADIIRFGQKKVVKVVMKMHETRTGRSLAVETASARSVDALEKPVEDAADRMFSRGHRLALSASLARPEVAPRESVELTVSVNKDAYVYVVADDVDGKTLVYPNAYAAKNLLRRGDSLKLPDSGWSITAVLPPGQRESSEKLLVLASQEPLDTNNAEKILGAVRTCLEGQNSHRCARQELVYTIKAR